MFDNPWLIGLIAGAVFLLLRGEGANGLVEQLLNFLRALTNTPGEHHEHDLSTDVGRICAAKCLADQFAARDKPQVGQAIRESLHVLIDQGGPPVENRRQ